MSILLVSRINLISNKSRSFMYKEPLLCMRFTFTSTGKDAALDAAHSLKTDTDSKLYGMGVGIRDGDLHGNAKTLHISSP